MLTKPDSADDDSGRAVFDCLSAVVLLLTALLGEQLTGVLWPSSSMQANDKNTSQCSDKIHEYGLQQACKAARLLIIELLPCRCLPSKVSVESWGSAVRHSNKLGFSSRQHA